MQHAEYMSWYVESLHREAATPAAFTPGGCFTRWALRLDGAALQGAEDLFAAAPATLAT